jgi:hypothetical protein
VATVHDILNKVKNASHILRMTADPTLTPQKTPLLAVLLLYNIFIDTDRKEDASSSIYSIRACYTAVIYQRFFLLASQLWLSADMQRYFKENCIACL